MISLHQLVLDNFMSISHLEMNFESNSIMSITGKNGSGKSALFYALALALTGYKKSDSYKEYVKAGEEKAHIYLDATLKGSPIIYDITIKEKNGAVERDVQYQGVNYHNSDYDGFIKEHELDQLENIMFVFQKSTSITSAKPTERASMLKKLFKFEFDDIVASLKEKLEEQKLNQAQLNAVLEELNSRTFEIQPLMRAKSANAIQAERVELNRITEDLAKLKDVDKESMSQNLLEIRKVGTQINDTSSKVEYYRTQINNIQNQLDEKDGYLAAHPLSEAQSKLEEMRKTYAEKQKDLQKTQEAASKVNADIRFTRTQISEKEEQIAIGETGVCHACGQPVDEHHVEELKTALSNLKNKLSELEIENEQLELNKKQKEVTSLDFDIKSQERIVTKIQQEEINRKATADRLTDTENNLAAMQNTLQTLQDARVRLLNEKAKFDEIAPLLEQKADLERQKSDLELQIEADLQGVAVLQEKIEANRRVEAERIERDNRVTETNNSLNELIKNTNTTKTVIDIYEKVFPNFCIMRACESIQNYINAVIQKLFPYMSIKLTASNRGKGVDFYYTSEASPDKYLNAKMASGAQEQILNLAYSIAVAQACGIKTILLDEVDAAMDKDNCGIIYEFMTTLEGFDQVIFVSHRPESLEAAKKSGATAYYVESGEYMEA